ncbi:hypothetical protein B0O99DRAFT_691957 [Bisporella sp. PMI_857]|nr:hypothetical protein B0O99DRAFT_691957 [Bisporella sp. PMI_857]
MSSRSTTNPSSLQESDSVSNSESQTSSSMIPSTPACLSTNEGNHANTRILPTKLTAFTATSTSRLSALQTGIFATSISQPGTWIGSHVFPLPPSIDLARFKSAWKTVVQRNEILRSRIMWEEPGSGTGTGGMCMLTLDEEEILWEERVMEEDDALEIVTGELRWRNMGFGEKLSVYTILQVRGETANTHEAEEQIQGMMDSPGGDPARRLYFIWTMHHAIYDNSHLFILDDVRRLYNKGIAGDSTLPIRSSFIEHFLDKKIAQIDYTAASEFWTQELSNCQEIATFPSLSNTKRPSPFHPRTRIETSFPFPAPQRTIIANATNSILIRAAWALVVAKHTATTDVVFGSTVAGRYDAETKGVVGPTFATVPVRVRFDNEEEVTSDFVPLETATSDQFGRQSISQTAGLNVKGRVRKPLAQHLEELQIAADNAREHEQVGLQFIQDLNLPSKRAASFQNLLVVQPKNHPCPAPVSKTSTHPLPSYRVSISNRTTDEIQNRDELELIKTHLDLTQTYGLVVEVTPSSSDNWLLTAKYDDRLLSATEVERICSHFSKAICEVFKEENRDTELREIDLLTKMDLDVIKELIVESCVEEHVPNDKPALLHQEFERIARIHPDSVAIDAWDISFTYAQLDDQSTNLAHHIYHHYLLHRTASEDHTSSIIPICFSKSAYAIVAMLSVLKTGCSYLPLDPGWPSERIKSILESVGGGEGKILDLVLCDNEQNARFEKEGLLSQSPRTKVLTVERVLLQNLQSSDDKVALSSDLASPGVLGPKKPLLCLPLISPSNPAYIIFTSGSTGTPKGIVISHNACVTNFQSRLSLLQSYTSATRVLQFSSFAFDVSVFDIFGTLAVGGCIAIPHELHRINPSQLAQFMTEKRVNWASLSPTFVEFLNPADVPTLEYLMLGGELLTREIIMKWKSLGPARKNFRLGNELGPSEVCVACVGNYDVSSETDPRDLGKPVGGNKLFLVDKDNGRKLVPVGCQGELVVYGESIMNEYFGDPEKTEEVLVELPEECLAWLPKAQHTKAFRTGDLFYLNASGHFMYVGRKDRQLKLRGFRMEPEEIERHMKLEDGVKGAVVSLVTFLQDRDRQVDNKDNGQELVAFFSFENTPPSLTENHDVSELSASKACIIDPSINRRLPSLIWRIKSRIEYSLPRYMAPSFYIPISHIPITRSGKQDRNQLTSLLKYVAPQLVQELRAVSNINPNLFGGSNGLHTVADKTTLSSIEYDIKVLWTKVLGFSRSNDIRLHSNFFHLGGNSIKAIHLSALANSMGLEGLDVASIYESPTLREMAALCSVTAKTDHATNTSWHDTEGSNPDKRSPIRMFGRLKSMNENDTSDLRKQRICVALGIDLIDLKDVYPCTPLQEGLLAISIRQPGTYVVARVWRLGREIDIKAFRDAWELTIDQNEILRTRIVEDGERFWQVVVAFNWMEITGQVVEEKEIRELNLSTEKKESIQRLGHDESKGRLLFFEILRDQVVEETYFKWTMHHAVYDAWVLSMIWTQVKNNYQMLAMQNPRAIKQQRRDSFAEFVRATYNSDLPPSSRSFWQTYLSASEPWPTFPTMQKVSNSNCQTDSVLSRYFELNINTIPSITKASLIRAAWAWVQSLYLGVDDIIFGVTLSGRSAPGASNVVGPTITTVPVRVIVSPGMQIKEFLERVQKEANAMMRHEHTGLSTIRALGDSAGWACDFSNILVVQDNQSQIGIGNGGEYETETWDGVEAVGQDTDISHSIPLVLECMLEDSGLRINAIFSSKSLDLGEVEFLLAHFSKAVEVLSEEAVSQASSLEQRTLGDIEFFSKIDEEFIKDCNQEEKPLADRLIHEAFSDIATQFGTKTAVDAWDIQFTYEELNHGSDIVAKKLIQDHQVGPGVLVAISFEKSGWAVLAMLSIWKAGGGFVPLDLSHPKSRLEDIIRSTRAKTVLCSATRTEQLKNLLAGAVLALNYETLGEMEESMDKMDKMEANVGLSLPSPSQIATPQDVCYVLFTSGSTGRPKGVVLEHASVLTSLLGHADGLRIKPSSRVLQFAAYTFDTSIGEIFSPLLLGATLCVPSEQQRLSSLTQFINEKSVDWVWLTPTVASFLDPRAVPGVKTLLIGGEKASIKLFQEWVGRGVFLVYGYGPTEASITTTLNFQVTEATDPANIGMPICASTWIVDPCENSRLLPIGCVGELVVSGPIVGRGYLNDELKTAMAFGEVPEVWERMVRSRARKTSHRERLYRTGDLVRYDVTGNIVFVGRKDNQVKFRGQRIELSEITNYMDDILGDRCSSIVEKIEIKNTDTNGESAEAVLVAFFTLPGSTQGKDSRDSQGNGTLNVFHHPSSMITQVINDIETHLQALLPQYMIPSLFVPLEYIPVTTTGKVDRNRLKKELLQIVNDIGRADFMPERDRLKEQPRNELEKQLQEIWCSILALPAERIGIRDSFLHLGGDSLKAIALAHAARRAALNISVADVFLHPILSDMARFVRESRAVIQDHGAEESKVLNERKQLAAFSILSSNDDIEAITSHASEQCGITMDDVEDIYPCTAMQIGMLVSSSMVNHEASGQKSDLYVLRRRIAFGSGSAAMNFSAAWEVIRRRTPILRTRIVQYKSTIYQVVVKSHAASIPHPPDSATGWYGRSLADLKMGPNYECEISLHHSIYDAVLLPRLLKDIRQHCDEKAATSFWGNYLAPTDGRVSKITHGIFPIVSQSSLDFEQQQTYANEISRYFSSKKIENKSYFGITLANIINLAWAIVTARHTGAEEVMFGNTLSGRDVILEAVRSDLGEGLIEGPTLTTVPLRFKLGANKSVLELLHEAQRDAVEVRRHQHLGLAKIAKLGNCKFRTLLVVQTPTDIVDTLEFSSYSDESVRKDLINGDIISAVLQSLPGIRGVSESQIAIQEYPLVLECLVNMTELTGVRAYYDERVIERRDIFHILSQFEQAILTLVEESNQHLKTSEIDLVTSTDILTLSEWNKKPPEKSQRTLLDLFLHRSKINPGNHSLYSTEKIFSYEELDRYSSHAARYISEQIRYSNQDAQTPFTVAICYEKSVWAVVSILAIMKIGAAYVPLDPSSPDSRLAMILDDVKASAIVCSPKQAEKFSKRAAISNIILFDGKIHEQIRMKDSEGSYKSTNELNPESIAYILYTSGSTGRPKGVLVPHSAICTSILAYSPTVKLSQNSRVLQFSSFGFDASVGEIFATLSAGGCICMPNDEERLGHISRFMNESRVDWAFLTPVTLRIITPNDVPLLRVLVVGGEPLPPSLFKTWATRPETLQLMEAYGPTECCVFSTMNTTVTPETHPQDIGFPLGGTAWVVDPYDYHKLTPVGCVGELLISGNTIAAGYYNLLSTDSSGFVEQSPRWASLFPKHMPMRRIYRTGDLVRFKADGSINYVARKDNQVNLRGMRMELGEIEYHLARSEAGDKAAPIVVLTSIPNQGELKKEISALACFFVTDLDGNARPEPLRMTQRRRLKVRSIVAYLEGRVPAYMIPTMFIPLPCFPENTSGKVERKTLVEDVLGGFDEDDFKYYTVSTTQASNVKQPMTTNEEALQQIWSQLLGIDANIIKQDDSFFRLGGDSVGIIQMVTILRQKGLRLNPVEAMINPKLSTVASNITLIVRENVAAHCSKTTPFSLLRRQFGESSIERLAMSAAKQCGVASEMIEDIYPCTPLQEGLFSLSERIPGSYFNQQAFCLGANIDIDRFVAAYRGLCKAHPILRTRIIRGDDGKSYQVVLHHDIQTCFDGDELEASEITDSGGSFSLSGKSLHSIVIRAPATIIEPKYPVRVLRVIHHALYDAWSLSNLDTELEERYSAAESFISPEIPSYAQFIEFISKNDLTTADNYWKQYLDGARQTCYPAVPQTYQPQTTSSIKNTFELEWDKSSTILQDRNTKAAVARLAWAILLSKYSNDADITFGVAISGRDAPIEGIEAMTGPTNTTIPVRYQLLTRTGRSPSIADALELAQSQTAEMNKFQYHGLQNIMRISPEAHEVCNFRSLLVVQPAQRLQKWADSRIKILQELPKEETSALRHPYPIVIELCFQNNSNNVEVYAHYDDLIFSSPQVDLILRQFYMTLQALFYSDPSAKIDALNFNDRDSLRLMRRFHDETCKPPAERDIVSLITDQRVLNPEASAISAWDGKMSYADLDTISSNLGAYLRDPLGLKPDSIVAICFEKSVWAIVAMLAIMKSGCAYVPIDLSAPDSYKSLLLDQLAAHGHANLFLVSEEHFQSTQQIVPPGTQLHAISKRMVANLPKSCYENNMALPSSAAYTLFTSGSTGVPKGVIMEHRSACTSILAHGSACKFNQSTRTLQFASFTFDASIMEIWTTLAFGGCVCIPSESQRLNNLEQYITDANVNWAFLTPTVSGLIRKERVPSLRTLVLGGEALTLGTIGKWTAVDESSRKAGQIAGAKQALEVMNGYGPTECCVFTCVNTKITPATEPQNIGGAVGVSAWIVDPRDYNHLVPLTCPGELLIIGPTLARGYLADPAKTEKAFVYPQWSRSILGTETRAYRTGDLASCGADGRIKIIGRVDTQIKLNGIRIELGEIANALLSCASDTQVEVVVDKLAPSTPGNENHEAPNIVAFMKFGNSSSTLLDIASFERELCSRMATRVPAYMIPSQFITVSQFPTTTAGKVDRKALRSLVQVPENVLSIFTHRNLSLSNRASASEEDNNERPESASEIILRDLWAEVLEIENPSLIRKQDSFFALGGESIRAIRLVALAREKHNMSLTVNEIFRHVFLADMAAQMTEVAEEIVEDQPFDLLLDY